MTPSSEEINPELQAFEALAYETFAELALIHSHQHPLMDQAVFLNQFKELRDNPTVSGDVAIEQLETAQDAGKEGRYLETALVVSSAYLAQAYQAADRGIAGRAWHALAKACYWCGVMRSVTNKIDLTLQGVDAIRKAEAGGGGSLRSSRYAAARAAIVKLAHELKPKRGWASMREISSAIRKKADKLGPEDPTFEALKVVEPTAWERYCAETLKKHLSQSDLEALFLRSQGVPDN
jgi:hypothetical protein